MTCSLINVFQPHRNDGPDMIIRKIIDDLFSFSSSVHESGLLEQLRLEALFAQVTPTASY